MKDFAKDMNSNILGNPHSRSPSSTLSTLRIEAVRARMLEFFKADPKHFDLIFVANTTAAIKMVMDGMCGSAQSPEADSFWYGYHADSHTSLVGGREIASAGAMCFASDQDVETWLSGDNLAFPSSSRPMKPIKDIGLFAYPAQSNMNGRRLPLSWPGRIRASELPQHYRVYSLVDAAAFVATAQLDLSDWKNAPDFTALSFYKIFGFPDLGGLLVRKGAERVLQRRRFFGGGTVDMVINAMGDPDEAWYARKESSIHDAFEDGTPAFHSIIALDSALKIHSRLYGSMEHVSHHTSHLAKMLYDRLTSLSHANGSPLCCVYRGTNSRYGDSMTQGPTIAFNLQDSNGVWINKSHFEQLAIVNGIQLRTGGVCNPGGIAHFLALTPNEMRHNFVQGLRCGNQIDILNGKPTGIIRVSLGAMSSMKDVQTVADFMDLFVDHETQSVGVTATEMPRPTVAEYSTDWLAEPNTHGTTVGFACPVAICRKICESDSDLSTHFCSHTLQGLSRNPPPKLERCRGEPALSDQDAPRRLVSGSLALRAHLKQTRLFTTLLELTSLGSPKSDAPYRQALLPLPER